MSSTRPLEPRRRASARERAARVVVWTLLIGVAPLACELTTDLDKLRGPMGGGGAANGGGGSAGQGGVATGGGTTGGGGHAGKSITIAYASAAEVDALGYVSGECSEPLWNDPTHQLQWLSEDKKVEATCQLRWRPTAGNENARTIYGCCKVDETSVAPTSIGTKCVSFHDDGIEYLFHTGAGGNETQTETLLSAWGNSCPERAVGLVVNHGSTTYPPVTVNCFQPLDGTQPCSKKSETGAKGYYLKWKFPLDSHFSTDHDEVSCMIGVRSMLFSTDGGKTPGFLTYSKQDNINNPSSWTDCTFAPP
jgi:hypothetical protein